MPSTPLRSKRPISDNELAVFEFETFDDEENTPLFANLKFQPKVKKAKPASASKAVKGSCIDQNALHLMRGMTSSRRKGLMDCMLTQQNAGSRRCPSSDPVDKKKERWLLNARHFEVCALGSCNDVYASFFVLLLPYLCISWLIMNTVHCP